VKRARVGLLMVALWLACRDREAVLAQALDNPVFEVASIRSNKSTARPSSRFPLGPGDAYVPGNFFSATNQHAALIYCFTHDLGATGAEQRPPGEAGHPS